MIRCIINPYIYNVHDYTAYVENSGAGNIDAYGILCFTISAYLAD